MTKISCFVLLSILLFLQGVNSQTPVSEPMLVSAEWLRAHLNDPDMVVVHFANNRRDYLQRHIPGARFLWDGWFAPSNPDLTYEVAPLEDLVRTVESLGISNNSRVVLYYTHGRMTQTARMFVTFDYLGLGPRTSILDGGLEEWVREGGPVTQEIPAFKEGSFTPRLQPSVIISGDEVLRNLKNHDVAIVDARTPNFYLGNGGGRPRPGHIPGAVNIPYSSMADSMNKFLKKEELKNLFDEQNIGEQQKVITYCHIGQQASLLYFVARYLGYDASLYDGSFEDWSGREETPVTNPSNR